MKAKIQDGPLARHPDDIEPYEEPNFEFPPEMGRKAYSSFRKGKTKERIESMPDNIDDIHIQQVIFAPPAVDMARLCGEHSDDEAIEAAVERFYVNTELYLQPGMLPPLGMVGTYGKDWELNAKGIYYRHFFSEHWVTDGRKLWTPSLEGIDWTDPAEKPRRERARAFIKHVLEYVMFPVPVARNGPLTIATSNEKWEKSEYAWDADAWADVFGKMRDDPVVAALVSQFPIRKLGKQM